MCTSFFRIIGIVICICFVGVFYSFANGSMLNGFNGFYIYDSIPLKAYNANSWSVLGDPYVKKYGVDSVAVELVLIHPNNLRWNDEQLVGYLDLLSVKPMADRMFTFYLLKNNSWQVRIASNGQVYIKQLNGDPPITDPAVIPIKTYFKRN